MNDWIMRFLSIALGLIALLTIVWLIWPNPAHDPADLSDAIQQLNQAWCDDSRGTLADGSCER